MLGKAPFKSYGTDVFRASIGWAHDRLSKFFEFHSKVFNFTWVSVADTIAWRGLAQERIVDRSTFTT